jgi:hypothetical protein
MMRFIDYEEGPSAFWQLPCGFHGNPATHSTAIRPVIPGVSGHP